MTLKPKQNSSGHILVYKPDHSSSYKSGTRKGYIYEHRYIAELNLGRPLLEGEVVHHLDGNPGNNSWENLLVLSSFMHKRLHEWLKKGGFTMETCEVNGVNSGKPTFQEPSRCKICSAPVSMTRSYCGPSCYKEFLRTNSKRPAVKVLKCDLETMNYSEIGRKYQVSNSAVKKWIKSYIKCGEWQS